MSKTKKLSIYEQEQNSLELALKHEMSTGVIKEINALIPFFGGLINDWLPSTYRYLKGSSFLDFMNGFHLLVNKKEMKDKDVEKLKKKLENVANYQFMSSILDGVFFSKSVLSRMILGMICAIYIQEPTIEYEDIIIINALKDTLDCELESFIKIYNDAKNNDASANGGKGAFYFKYNPEEILLNTTFFKFKNSNLIGTFENPSMLVGDLPEKIPGVITSISDKLYNYLLMLKNKSNFLS